MASTIRFAIDFALLFWAADKQSGCTFQGVWTKPLRRILFLGLALAGLLVAIRMGVESSKLRIGLGLVSGLLYAVASWIFAIGDFERPKISAALRKLWDRPEAQLAQTEQCVQRWKKSTRKSMLNGCGTEVGASELPVRIGTVIRFVFTRHFHITG